MKRRTERVADMDAYLRSLTDNELRDIISEAYFPDPTHSPDLIAAAERLLAEREGGRGPRWVVDNGRYVRRHG